MDIFECHFLKAREVSSPKYIGTVYGIQGSTLCICELLSIINLNDMRTKRRAIVCADNCMLSLTLCVDKLKYCTVYNCSLLPAVASY